MQMQENSLREKLLRVLPEQDAMRSVLQMWGLPQYEQPQVAKP